MKFQFSVSFSFAICNWRKGTTLLEKKRHFVTSRDHQGSTKDVSPGIMSSPRGQSKDWSCCCVVSFTMWTWYESIIHTQCPQTPSGHSFLMAPPLILKTHGFDVATMMFSHVIHELVPLESLSFTSLPGAQPMLTQTDFWKGQHTPKNGNFELIKMKTEG